MKTCGAKTRDGDPCKLAPVKGRERCRMHGGKQPLGIARPGTTHGRYSKHLPTRMLATYDETRTDPDLLDLAESIALTRSKVVDLLKRADHGDTPEWRQSLLSTFMAFKAAHIKKDGSAAARHLAQLETLIVSGAEDATVWPEIMEWEDHGRKLTESEQKRRVAMRQLVSTDQAILMVKALTAAVREHVHDPTALRAIADALARVAPVDSRPVAGTD